MTPRDPKLEASLAITWEDQARSRGRQLLTGVELQQQQARNTPKFGVIQTPNGPMSCKDYLAELEYQKQADAFGRIAEREKRAKCAKQQVGAVAPLEEWTPARGVFHTLNGSDRVLRVWEIFNDSSIKRVHFQSIILEPTSSDQLDATFGIFSEARSSWLLRGAIRAFLYDEQVTRYQQLLAALEEKITDIARIEEELKYARQAQGGLALNMFLEGDAVIRVMCPCEVGIIAQAMISRPVP